MIKQQANIDIGAGSIENVLRLISWFSNNINKKPSALRFAFSACLFYNKQNFYCWTISFGKREWGTEST